MPLETPSEDRLKILRWLFCVLLLHRGIQIVLHVYCLLLVLIFKVLMDFIFLLEMYCFPYGF